MSKSIPFSPKLLGAFIETTIAEIGAKNLPAVLTKSGLPAEWADLAHVKKLGKQSAAEAYAGLQQALRTYYGRGARGTLQRIGINLWSQMLDSASLRDKTQSKLLRGMPTTMRRKAALELLARLLGGDISVHTLDLNLLLVDRSSPTTLNQHDDEVICHVTHGLIREAIYWATEKEPNIEEIACRAMGAQNCEFKITFGEN